MRSLWPRALPLVLLTACGAPQTTEDSGFDAMADAQVPDVQIAPDAPAVPRCGPGAVPYRSRDGRCAVAIDDAGPQGPGRCEAEIRNPAVTRKTNEADGTAVVIPTGERVERAADRVAHPGFPMSLLRIPGTAFVVVSDGGIKTERLRVLDTSGATLRLAPGGEATFPANNDAREPALFYGLAWDATNRVLYASGGGSNRIWAFSLSTLGALTADPGRTIDFGVTEGINTGVSPEGRLQSAYPAGILLSADGSQMIAALQRGHALALIDMATRRVSRLVSLATTALRAPAPYALTLRAGDARHVYVTLWAGNAVAEVDLETATVVRTLPVGKNPSEIVFDADGRHAYVACADSDAVYDLDLGMVSPTARRIPVRSGAAPARRSSPSALALLPGGRLVTVDSGDNALTVLDVASGALVGRVPTEWFPTDVLPMDDGSLVVSTGKGIGMGANVHPESVDITTLMTGSVVRYPAPGDTQLASGAATVDQHNTYLRDAVGVTCPSGAAYDFPIPRPEDGTPSSRIKHVILVVRENKTYDALLGDYAGAPGNAADGDPALTIVPSARMPAVYPNLRALVRRFGNADNYYSNAEQSVQGHVWTTQGRTTDYTERTWLTTWGRATRTPPDLAISNVGTAEEGTLFEYMAARNVTTRVWGEVVGRASLAQSVSALYPGLVFNQTVEDIRKARAFGDWLVGSNSYANPMLQCQLPSFSYILLPNDHTEGGSAGRPTVESHLQDNDEATGYLIDALSHSPFWHESVVFVIEDDPQDGGDHVDNHRSLLLVASPWVKRGHTSHVHADEASIHRTIELILGLPPHNGIVADASPLYDLFTSTPDFAAFDYVPRVECPQLNPRAGRYVEASRRWDFSKPDEQPGLSRMVWQITHGGAEPPWTPALDGDGDDE